MALDHIPLEQISKDDIQRLIDDGEREGRTLEYKEKLACSSEPEKVELIRDVSAFANGAGGDLIFGIAEAAGGVPSKAVGLSAFDPDHGWRQIESTIRGRITPRIPGIRHRVVQGFENGPVLIIRIPRSWAGPHTVAQKDASHFWTRSSNGRVSMDVHEIRTAFEGAAGLSDRIRQWRDERLGRIIANDGPVALNSSSGLVLHLVPLDSFVNEWRGSVGDFMKHCRQFSTIKDNYAESSINFDGVITLEYDRRRDVFASAYTQLFRSGRVESVACRMFDREDGYFDINIYYYEKYIINSVRRFGNALLELGVGVPIIVMLSLVGAKGAKLSEGRHLVDEELISIDRDVLLLPEVVIENMEADLASLLKPMFDAIWNACGAARSPNYDESGHWRGDAFDWQR